MGIKAGLFYQAPNANKEGEVLWLSHHDGLAQQALKVEPGIFP